MFIDAGSDFGGIGVMISVVISLPHPKSIKEHITDIIESFFINYLHILIFAYSIMGMGCKGLINFLIIFYAYISY